MDTWYTVFGNEYAGTCLTFFSPLLLSLLLSPFFSPHFFSPTSSLQGDTLENVAKELDCIITTGKYLFLSLDISTSRTELMLEYSPSHSHQSPPPPHPQPSSLEDQEVPQVRVFPRVISRLNSQNGPEVVGVNAERWNGEQISDFVRKLGFLDTEKEGGDTIKHFLHVNEVCGCCE